MVERLLKNLLLIQEIVKRNELQMSRSAFVALDSQVALAITWCREIEASQ